MVPPPITRNKGGTVSNKLERFTGWNGLDAGDLGDMAEDVARGMREFRDALRAHGAAYGVDVGDAVKAISDALQEMGHALHEVEAQERFTVKD
jgi:Sec-independent protein translocase protein TatA